jgi:CBS domain-containing protein
VIEPPARFKVPIMEEVALSPPLTVNPEANVEEALLWKVVPRVRVSTREVVALSPPLTVNPEANVEEAETRMPAAVLVGVRVLWPSMAICQAPGAPPPPAQAAPVPDNSPALLTCTHWVAADTRLSKVTAPEANRVPMSLELPTTPSVVEGEAVLMPTWPSAPSAKNTGVARDSVDEATLKYPATVVVASSAVLDVSTSRAFV